MHRGQEGVAYACLVDGAVVRLGDPSGIESNLCIGHARYSTSGPYGVETQPLVLGDDFALVFNGTITNYRRIMRRLVELGYGPLQDYDGAVLATYIRHLLRSHGNEEGMRRAMATLEGSYSMVVINGGELLIARDPWGFRPLAIGYSRSGFAVASETSAIEALGMRWSEVEPGVAVSPERELVRMRSGRRAHCALEYIYFLRPDSFFNGVRAYEARKRLGIALARKETEEVDLVSPIPETARVAAQSYAWSLGKPVEEVVVKNRYLGRGFIKPPAQRGSELFNVISDVVRGKSVALVDDSIIRGDTMGRVISRIRDSGARRIHVRVSSPPVRYPCFMGMDFPSRRELVAHGKSVEEVRRIIGSDSLVYLSVEEMEEAIGVEVCAACFTGRYPFPLNIEEMESAFARG
jgi:amidophosphoribosyltransferase